MTLPERMVEAAARALWEAGCTPRGWRWEALPHDKKELWRTEARAALSAALAVAEGEGVVLCKVPGEAGFDGIVAGVWDTCRDTFLAGRVRI